jgi:glycosyltransferase involved in cell wall biosynthesis
MKILAVSHSAILALNQRVFRELENRGHQLSVVVPRVWQGEYDRGPLRPERLRGFNGGLLPLPVVLSGSIPLHLYTGRLREVLSNVSPDLLYIEEEPYSVAAFQWATAASQLCIPVVFFSLQNIAKRYPVPFRLMERRVWRSSRSAIALSDSVEETLRTRGFSGSINIVPLSVDLATFFPQPRDKSLSLRLQLRGNVVGYFGRLVPEKGISVLLEAFREIRRHGLTTLLIVGGGPLENLCRKEDGVVVLTGVAHEDIATYLSLVDLIVLPSVTTRHWKEQFGRVLIEAWACGLPVVGSDSGEIPRLVRQTGGGVVVPEGNVPRLAAEVERMLGAPDLRRSMGMAARLAVEANYSVSAVGRQLENALTAA